MEIGVACRIERYENIGHDTASAIDRAFVFQCRISERIGEVDAVCRHVFAVVVAVQQVAVILFPSFAIRFLDGTSRRSIVARYGEPHHRAVGERYGTLYQTFAECTSPDNHAAVPVLHGSR